MQASNEDTFKFCDRFPDRTPRGDGNPDGEEQPKRKRGAKLTFAAIHDGTSSQPHVIGGRPGQQSPPD